MHHWQSEHEYGTCMMVLRHNLAAMCDNTCHDQWVVRAGPTAWPLRPPVLNPLDFYLWGHLKSLVYAVPVDNEEALHHCIVDACKTYGSYRSIFERMWRSTMRRVEVSMNLMDILSTYYKCIL
jgi:hypothetical protein